MMSEKRFTINLEDECIDDAEERIFISFLDRIDFYELCGFLNEQQSIINKLQEEKKYYLKKAFLFEKGIAIHLQKEEQMELYTYVDLEMKR